MSDRVELISQGRAAAESGRWPEAFDALAAADEAAALNVDDLEVLGWAAFFSARPEVSVDARQRAFAAVRASDPERAAMLAMYIAGIHLGREAVSVGLGWAEQAANLLADRGECEAAAWLAWVQALVTSESGQREAALAACDDVIALARRLGVNDVEALASLLKGQLLTSGGSAEDGARLIDPVMALAIGGVLGPFAAAWVYCGTISTCASTGDVARAWEWTNEVGRCSVAGTSDFPGDCRLHRAELLRIRGEWAKAELEMASVCDDLGSWASGHVAIAQYELGELSLKRGDLPGAAEAFAQCREHGHSALPGMASVELASGNPEVAVALLRAELATRTDPLVRSKLLPVGIEAMLAAERIDEARMWADELRELAGAWPAPLHQARAAHAEGSVALATGDESGARDHLTSAVEAWRRVPAPYEEALSRVSLAHAEEPAARVMHLEAALETFNRLGAVREARSVAGELGHAEAVDRVTLALMFTDIEDSTAILAELGDERWLKVLRRHDAMLHDLFRRHHGEVQVGTGDGFFAGFPTADAALDCALDVQRTVEEVRVRVGVHFTEANRDQGGLSGRGVHEAARISALGAGGDIVVSHATLEQATKPYPTRETRTVCLKGLPGEPSQKEIIRVALRSGPSISRIEKRLDRIQQVRHEGRSPENITAWLATPRSFPDSPTQLSELVIHQQDIRRAVARPRAIPADRVGAVLDHSISKKGHKGVNYARRRVRGLRLVATDMDWTWGDGAEVRGPGEALLMAANGREQPLLDLTGPGLETLTRTTIDWSSRFGRP